MTAPARPAVLQAAAETETAEGGRLRTWTDVATVWVALAYGTSGAEPTQEMPPVRVETATAVARQHPAAAAGQRLAVDGDPVAWRVLAVRPCEARSGWMTLVLDREAG